MMYLSVDSITTVFSVLVEKIEMFINHMLYPRTRIVSHTKKYVDVEIIMPSRIMKLRIKIPRGPKKHIQLLCKGKNITQAALPYLTNDCSQIITSVGSERIIFGSELTRVEVDEIHLCSPRKKYKRENVPTRGDLLDKRRKRYSQVMQEVRDTSLHRAATRSVYNVARRLSF